MKDRRTNPRLLCADLVEMEWRDGRGRWRKVVANLEDISQSGVCLQLERDLPLDTALRIHHSRGILEGKVRYCTYREIGYFIGVQFESGIRWNRRQFKPMHLLDPRRLAPPGTPAYAP